MVKQKTHHVTTGRSSEQTLNELIKSTSRSIKHKRKNLKQMYGVQICKI